MFCVSEITQLSNLWSRRPYVQIRGSSMIFIGEGLQVQEAPPGPGGSPFRLLRPLAYGVAYMYIPTSVGTGHCRSNAPHSLRVTYGSFHVKSPKKIPDPLRF